MSVFVDTSALYSVFDAADTHHNRADSIWRELLDSDETLVTSNYVLLEAYALMQARLGLDAIRILVREVIPVFHVLWVEERDHMSGVAAVLAAGRRNLSLVDCVSFHLMRRFDLRKCFAFDVHFAEQGFDVLPESQSDCH